MKLLCSTVFWNAASAIATLLASGIALFLGLRRTKKQLDSALLWDFTTEANPILIICNSSSRLIVIKEILIKYRNNRIFETKLTESFEVKTPSDIHPNSYIKIPNIDLSELRKGKADDLNKKQKQYRLKIQIIDISGRRYISKQKLSEKEISFLFIGRAILDRNNR